MRNSNELRQHQVFNENDTEKTAHCLFIAYQQGQTQEMSVTEHKLGFVNCYPLYTFPS